MDVLILKLGATGDVVRTTTLLRKLSGRVTWVTTSNNKALLEGYEHPGTELRIVPWENRSVLQGATFDLAINLSWSARGRSEICRSISAKRIFGANINDTGEMSYSKDSSDWLDLSLISIHGRKKADELKLQNRRTYQDLVFAGLGLEFRGEEYFLPPTAKSDLQGDVAIAPEAGAVWPMKKWAHYSQLKSELESRGLKVNYLPTRPTLLELPPASERPQTGQSRSRSPRCRP